MSFWKKCEEEIDKSGKTASNFGMLGLLAEAFIYINVLQKKINKKV
ncbi:hypothetical protein [Gemella cuniculi]|nr:hypothetical protein [Gemella cuniculi]